MVYSDSKFLILKTKKWPLLLFLRLEAGFFLPYHPSNLQQIHYNENICKTKHLSNIDEKKIILPCWKVYILSLRLELSLAKDY